MWSNSIGIQTSKSEIQINSIAIHFLINSKYFYCLKYTCKRNKQSPCHNLHSLFSFTWHFESKTHTILTNAVVFSIIWHKLNQCAYARCRVKRKSNQKKHLLLLHVYFSILTKRFFFLFRFIIIKYLSRSV